MENKVTNILQDIFNRINSGHFDKDKSKLTLDDFYQIIEKLDTDNNSQIKKSNFYHLFFFRDLLNHHEGVSRYGSNPERKQLFHGIATDLSKSFLQKTATAHVISSSEASKKIKKILEIMFDELMKEIHQICKILDYESLYECLESKRTDFFKSIVSLLATRNKGITFKAGDFIFPQSEVFGNAIKIGDGESCSIVGMKFSEMMNKYTVMVEFESDGKRSGIGFALYE